MESRINVWRLITHHERPKELLRWAETEGCLAIGWGRIGDIRAEGYGTAREIAIAINEHYLELNNSGLGGPSLYHFCYGVQPGDFVILSTGSTRACVMEVTGEYEYKAKPEEPPTGDYQHRRKAQPLSIDPNSLWRAAGAAPAKGHNIRWTFLKCLRAIDEATRATLAD